MRRIDWQAEWHDALIFEVLEQEFLDDLWFSFFAPELFVEQFMSGAEHRFSE